MKPVLDNLAVSPFSDLKELTKAVLFMITFIVKHEAKEMYNAGIIKRTFSSLV